MLKTEVIVEIPEIMQLVNWSLGALLMLGVSLGLIAFGGAAIMGFIASFTNHRFMYDETLKNLTPEMNYLVGHPSQAIELRYMAMGMKRALDHLAVTTNLVGKIPSGTHEEFYANCEHILGDRGDSRTSA